MKTSNRAKIDLMLKALGLTKKQRDFMTWVQDELIVYPTEIEGAGERKTLNSLMRRGLIEYDNVKGWYTTTAIVDWCGSVGCPVWYSVQRSREFSKQSSKPKAKVSYYKREYLNA